MAEPENSDEQTIVVGLVADEGFPSIVAGRLERTLPRVLSDRIDTTIEWDVRMSTHTMPLSEENVVSLSDGVAGVKSREAWDIAVYVTDLPRFAHDRVVVADVKVDDAVAIVSLPALGLGASRRLSKVVLHLIGKIHAAEDSETAGRGVVLKGAAGPVRLTGQPHSGIDTYTAQREFQEWFRLAVGMVLSNRPWRLLWNLKGAMAAAGAAGAFGIFYASLAKLSDQMSLSRLWVITVVVIVVMTLWLVARNGLWEVPLGSRSRRRFALYNTSSLATVAISVVFMYLALLAALLIGSAIVIPASYLGAQLDHDVGVRSYVDLAWLSASMGMIAGALGASFDTEDDVRKALYSEREVARRKQAEA